jgi:hypothetical protein
MIRSDAVISIFTVATVWVALAAGLAVLVGRRLRAVATLATSPVATLEAEVPSSLQDRRVWRPLPQEVPP